MQTLDFYIYWKAFLEIEGLVVDIAIDTNTLYAIITLYTPLSNNTGILKHGYN